MTEAKIQDVENIFSIYKTGEYLAGTEVSIGRTRGIPMTLFLSRRGQTGDMYMIFSAIESNGKIEIGICSNHFDTENLDIDFEKIHGYYYRYDLQNPNKILIDLEIDQIYEFIVHMSKYFSF